MNTYGARPMPRKVRKGQSGDSKPNLFPSALVMIIKYLCIRLCLLIVPYFKYLLSRPYQLVFGHRPGGFGVLASV